MSESEKVDVEKNYNESQEIIEKINKNDALLQQNKAIAEARKDNDAKQRNILQQEKSRLKEHLKQMDEAVHNKKHSLKHIDTES